MQSWKSYYFDLNDRKYFLYTIDIILIAISTLFYCKNFAPELSALELLSQHPQWLISILVIWTLVAYVVDIYNLEMMSDLYQALKNTFVAAYISLFTYLLLPFITPVLPTSRNLVYFYIFSFIFSILIWRYLYFRLFSQSLFLKRLLIVTNGWNPNSLVNLFSVKTVLNHHLGYKIVGIVDTELNSDVEYKGVKIIREANNLPKITRRLKIDEIIIDVNASGSINSNLFQKLVACRMKGVAVTSIIDFYEMLTGRVPVQHQENEFYLAFPYNTNNYKKGYLIFSRGSDILLGLIGTMVCAIFIPLIYLINFIANKGPIFYSQERVGLYGKPFLITKFRSMVVDAEKASGATWAQKNDNRITLIGKFLRKTRLDELPQSWSVLKGDMSIIGPRPERPFFVEKLKQEIPFYDTRHLVKPGLTGWAQVLYPYGSDTHDAMMKLQYDLFYIKNRSVLLDLKIILKTISVVIRFKGL